MDVRSGGGDASGGGGGVAAASNYSNGFVRSMVGYSSSPFLFWLLTVSLVAVIHLASGYLAPPRSEKEEEAEEVREGTCNDVGILGMMQSFMPVGEEAEFLEKMRAYDDGGGVDVRAPQPAPPAASFSFKFQHQIPEIPSETAMVSRETPVQEKEREEHEQEAEQEAPIPIQLESVNKEELKQEQEVVVVENTTKIVASAHNYRFSTERDFRGFVKEPEAMTARVKESFLPMEEPEERRVVDRASHRDGGFLSAEDFRPVNEPDVCESVASSGKAARPAERRKLLGSSPSDASSKGAVSGRMSYVSEFSGFDDSDSESSVSDGYSVKELVVDSDSEWFISEKDFPAAAVAQDAASLRSYKAKVLKAMEILEEAARLERSLQESSTTASPDSVGQASHDSIEEGSLKYPEDMWSRSPSPDVEFKEEEAVEERSMEDGEARRRSLQLELTDGSDGELSSDSTKKVAQAYDVASIGKNSLEHSEKEILIRTDHSDEVLSDVKRSPEPISEKELVLSSDDAKRSREPSEKEFVGTNDHSHELVSDDRKEIVNTNDQSYAVVSDDKRSPEPSEKDFVASDDHAYGVVSEAKNISDPTEEFVCSDDHPYGVVSETQNISEPAEETDVRTNDHSDNAARQADVLITGKKKVEDEEGEDPEDKWNDLTEEEEDELESLWEHQDLIEQLKMELKKVRSIGLPTIMEESETPKAPMEDLKPWRIDAKFLREDPMDELNKFYKSYRERMRKFDILCYQKMYAIDFLQLRGPPHSTGSQKTLSPTVTSILTHNFRSSRRRSADDPSERFLKELRYDLETVYVGQMCLSWEFLRWQYEQARDLPESDPYHSHQYNQVAGEFQQFQVVVQRFIEDESFKGPRLPNYINNRCVLRNLLQVPVIKEDSLKDRMEDQRKGNYVITSEELEDIMEESMRILWEFIKADKVETTPVLKGLSSTHVELQDPLEHDLMMHIHSMLQKKEKRLKDLLRTGNCLVKKFKKPKEDRSNLNLFFSQVDMKLVARVLRMPRITSDQLQWCHVKLEKIILVDRKLHREPSFLLFPC